MKPCMSCHDFTAPLERLRSSTRVGCSAAAPVPRPGCVGCPPVGAGAAGMVGAVVDAGTAGIAGGCASAVPVGGVDGGCVGVVAGFCPGGVVTCAGFAGGWAV